jgi:hypothetical protein
MNQGSHTLEQPPAEEAAGLLSAIMEREPQLAASGMSGTHIHLRGLREAHRSREGQLGSPAKLELFQRDVAEAKIRFLQERDELASSVAAFIAARDWLRRHAKPRKTANSAIDSYGLRLLIERDAGHIAHGVCIAALLAEGYAIKRTADKPSINVWANISIVRARR